MMNGEVGRLVSALDAREFLAAVSRIVGWDIIVSAVLVFLAIGIFRLATIKVRRRSGSSRSQ
jgi:hypothetical protein